MDEAGIIKICDTFQLAYGRVRSAVGVNGSRNISVSCPLAIVRHGDPNDDNMSCSIEVLDDGPSRVRCFSGNCRFHGSLLKLVREAVKVRGSAPHLTALLADVSAYEFVSLNGKVKRLKQRLQDEQTFKETKSPIRDREAIPESAFEPFAGRLPQYAIERGISIETARVWGLGYDKENGYLVFPVRRRDGTLVGLVGRAVSDRAKHTHHNYGGLDKAKNLFGAHMLENGKPVVVVESCIDTLNTWQALDGKACVAASLGEGFTDRHALTLASCKPPFVCIFTDGDPAGHAMASKIAYILDGHMPVKLMECPWGPIIDSTADGKPVRMKIDPSVLPYPIINKLFDEARVIRRRIEWSKPLPYFDPNTPSS